MNKTYVAIRSHQKTVSAVRTIQILLFSHLIIVTFQIPLRAIFLDTTYFRDILLFLTVSLTIFSALLSGRARITKFSSLLGPFFLLYLSYGLLITFLMIMGDELPIIDSIREYRNHFMPIFLFFLARKYINSIRMRVKLINLLFLIALILIVSVIGEYIAFNLGVSKYSVPWYSYTFENSVRYIGNNSETIGYITPENSPILGLLAWPHATAATFMALFAFCFPFLYSNHANHKSIMRRNYIWGSKLSITGYTILLISAIIGILILKVKMHMASMIVLLLVLPLMMNRRLFFHNSLIITIVGIIVLSSDLFLSTITHSIQAGFIGTENREATLDLILRLDIIYFILGLPLSSIFFGWWGDVGEALETTELRLLFLSLRFGLVWLFLFLSIFFVGFIYAIQIARNRQINQIDRLFSMGITGMQIIYLLDMGHYARLMAFPNIDFWAVSLGAMSTITGKKGSFDSNRFQYQGRYGKSNTNNRRNWILG